MIFKQVKNLVLLSLAVCISLGTMGWGKNTKEDLRINAISGNAGSDFPIHPDHIIFLWLENKDFTSIIGRKAAPYINSLIARGTLFTNSYAITHPSYPNYVDFFAGNDNGIINDACIYNSTIATPNLYSILDGVGKSFAWYSEDLPMMGSKICREGDYVQKHNPTTIFTNVPSNANKRFADFPTDYNHLENVVCISPNQMNDMHSGSIKQGDEWFKKHLSPLVDWCITHNSVFVIYFDEGEYDNDNRIPVLAVGQHVKEGYRANAQYDHFCWTKTISAMFSAPEDWTDNLVASKLITGCWK